ncbi:MAG: MFS transporter [Planctomycetota bacterium]|nr:MFS transporter [Planctomycetota bacterium]
MTDPAPRPGFRERLKQTFAALKHRNYRLWFVGQLISLFGTWMQMTAQGYLVFELTRSPAYLGYVGFAGGVPSWLFMLYGGVIADRLDRRLVLIVTQILMMALAFVLAALTFLEVVQPWHILALAALLGVANAFDAPARQAFVVELVDREDMTNAIALNGSMFNLAAALGPAVAGVVYATLGPGWCFTINALTFIAVIVALFLMKLAPREAPAATNSPFADLKEGLRYTAREPLIRTIIVIISVIGLFGISYATLMPAWAVKVLGGDARTNGWLMSARGIGAVVGTLLVAALGRIRIKGKLLLAGQFVFPMMLAVFAMVRVLPMSLLALGAVGAAVMVTFNLSNACIQQLTPDPLRGRVMSVYMLTFFGTMPLGALLAGAVAEHIGEPATVLALSDILLAFALIIWLLAPRLRKLE